MLNPIVATKKEKKTKFDAEWLRSFKGFDEYSEIEAEKTIRKLQEVATIVCTHLKKIEQNERFKPI